MERPVENTSLLDERRRLISHHPGGQMHQDISPRPAAAYSGSTTREELVNEYALPTMRREERNPGALPSMRRRRVQHTEMHGGEPRRSVTLPGVQEGHQEVVHLAT